MKLFYAIFALSALLLVITIDGRKDLREYWKITMKDQPMPEIIQDFISDPYNREVEKMTNSKHLLVDKWSDLSVWPHSIENKHLVADKWSDISVWPNLIENKPLVADKWSDISVWPNLIENKSLVADKWSDASVWPNSIENKPLVADKLSDQLLLSKQTKEGKSSDEAKSKPYDDVEPTKAKSAMDM